MQNAQGLQKTSQATVQKSTYNDFEHESLDSRSQTDTIENNLKTPSDDCELCKTDARLRIVSNRHRRSD